MKKDTITIVLPCYNEEKAISHSVDSVFHWLRRKHLNGDIIVVDDGSIDGSASLLRTLKHRHKKHLKILRHIHNRGLAAALRTGCDNAKGDIIIYMDSDGQFCIDDAGILLAALRKCNIASGNRYNRADSIIRRMNAYLWNTLTSFLLGIHARDVDCGLKAFRRSVWQSIRPRIATGGLMGAEFWFRVEKSKISWIQLPIRHYERLHGQATGARIKVIYRAFRDLGRLLWKEFIDSHSRIKLPKRTPHFRHTPVT